MTLDARGYVSIVEIIVFIPSAIASAVICSRHGFSRSSGWIYTLVLSIIRTVGAVCQLLTYNDSSDGLIKATVIIDSIGLSPLLLATLGMLSRLVDQINYHSQRQGFFKLSHFRLIQLLITLGLILSIAGGSGSSSGANGSTSPSGTSYAGVILYVVSYFALVLVLFAAFRGLAYLPPRERRVALGVLLAAPFILVRLGYSVLAVFLHDHDFNVVDGSVPILVGMAVLEEFFVVFVYIFLGFHVDILRLDQQGPIQNRPWKEAKKKDGRRSDRSDVGYRRGNTESPSGTEIPMQAPQQTYYGGGSGR